MPGGTLLDPQQFARGQWVRGERKCDRLDQSCLETEPICLTRRRRVWFSRVAGPTVSPWLEPGAGQESQPRRFRFDGCLEREHPFCLRLALIDFVAAGHIEI